MPAVMSIKAIRMSAVGEAVENDVCMVAVMAGTWSGRVHVIGY